MKTYTYPHYKNPNFWNLKVQHPLGDELKKRKTKKKGKRDRYHWDQGKFEL